MSLESFHRAYTEEGTQSDAAESRQREPTIDTRPATFKQLYKLLPLETARDISRKERIENEYTSSTLTYGEIQYEDFVEVKLRCASKQSAAIL